MGPGGRQTDQGRFLLSRIYNLHTEKLYLSKSMNSVPNSYRIISSSMEAKMYLSERQKVSTFYTYSYTRFNSKKSFYLTDGKTRYIACLDIDKQTVIRKIRQT